MRFFMAPFAFRPHTVESLALLLPLRLLPISSAGAIHELQVINMLEARILERFIRRIQWLFQDELAG